MEIADKLPIVRFFFEFAEPDRFTIDRRDIDPGLEQAQGHRTPDPARCSGDDRHLPLAWHRRSLRFVDPQPQLSHRRAVHAMRFRRSSVEQSEINDV